MSTNKYEEPCPCCGVIEWSLGVKFERERIIRLLESSTYDKIDTEGNIHKAWKITPEEVMKRLNGENE